MSSLPSSEFPIDQIESLVAADPGGRGASHLVVPGDLLEAARLLTEVQRVAVVSGFFIPSAMKPETDGPPGAAALGAALTSIGVDVRFRTDERCAAACRAAGMTPLDVGLCDVGDVDCLIAVERPGRAADGRCYTMRGRDLSPWTAPLDEAFLQAAQRGVATVGVGDGGNEIGMGKVLEQVRACIPLGETIACIVPVDRLVVGGVSNWGAWGLVAAISVLVGRDLAPSTDDAFRLLIQLVDAGAVDGVTGKPEPTVDGLPWPVHAEILQSLHAILKRQAE